MSKAFSFSYRNNEILQFWIALIKPVRNIVTLYYLHKYQSISKFINVPILIKAVYLNRVKIMKAKFCYKNIGLSISFNWPSIQNSYTVIQTQAYIKFVVYLFMLIWFILSHLIYVFSRRYKYIGKILTEKSIYLFVKILKIKNHNINLKAFIISIIPVASI